VSIYLPERTITKFGITELCRILPQHNFLRVHKSFVVNMDKITAFSAQGLDVGNTSIPVGRSYKEQVHTYLKSKPI
jgi:DNA-binding LytR/AlgR family response regulator